MQKIYIILVTLLVTTALADESSDKPETTVTHRETKDIKYSVPDNDSDEPILYSGFDHSILTHLKPDKPKPHLPHIPHIPNLSDALLILKPYQFVSKPGHYHHKPDNHHHDDKHEVVYPVLYSVYFPLGLPRDHGYDGDYYKPYPCHTTTDSPSEHNTEKPLDHIIDHIPYYQTHYKPEYKPEQHYSSHKPEHYYSPYKPNDYDHHHDPHHSKPSKHEKPSLSSIIPQLLWPFYSRLKDVHSDLETSRPPSVFYPLYDENEKTSNADLKSNEGKNVANSDAKSK